ncbi:MAG: SOS response-associated peptidase family protein [Gammaproteobacteria bacterium]
MCGRFALYSRPDVLAERFRTDTIPGMEISPRYNIAPSQNVAIVRDEGGQRRFGFSSAFLDEGRRDSTTAIDS